MTDTTAAAPPHPDGAVTDRDFAGYRDGCPDIRWPGGARLALSIVVNVEEGESNSDETNPPMRNCRNPNREK